MKKAQIFIGFSFLLAACGNGGDKLHREEVKQLPPFVIPPLPTPLPVDPLPQPPPDAAPPVPRRPLRRSMTRIRGWRLR